MCLDLIRTIKCALAGTATSKFTEVLEAVFGVDEENPPEFEAEEDEPDVVPEEGLTTKEAVEGESLSDLWLVLVWGSVLNAKHQPVLLLQNRNVNLANQLKAGYAPL